MSKTKSEQKQHIIRVFDLKNKSNVWTIDAFKISQSEKAEILENIILGNFKMEVL